MGRNFQSPIADIIELHIQLDGILSLLLERSEELHEADDRLQHEVPAHSENRPSRLKCQYTRTK
jgi:hypothetical protein